MLFRVCLERGICCNALELCQLAYGGDVDSGERMLRVWVGHTMAKDVKAEPAEPAPQVSASATTATPATAAAVGGGPTEEGAVAGSDRPEVKEDPLPATQQLAETSVWWPAVVEYPERATRKRENANRNRWRPTPKQALDPSRRMWQPIRLPSSDNPEQMVKQFRVDVSWGALLPEAEAQRCVQEMVNFCRDRRGEVLPSTIAKVQKASAILHCGPAATPAEDLVWQLEDFLLIAEDGAGHRVCTAKVNAFPAVEDPCGSDRPGAERRVLHVDAIIDWGLFSKCKPCQHAQLARCNRHSGLVDDIEYDAILSLLPFFNCDVSEFEAKVCHTTPKVLLGEICDWLERGEQSDHLGESVACKTLKHIWHDMG